MIYAVQYKTRLVGDDINRVFDLSLEIADNTDCSPEDMNRIIEMYIELLRGERNYVEYRCCDGSVVRIRNRFGRNILEISSG